MNSDQKCAEADCLETEQTDHVEWGNEHTYPNINLYAKWSVYVRRNFEFQNFNYSIDLWFQTIRTVERTKLSLEVKIHTTQFDLNF